MDCNSLLLFSRLNDSHGERINKCIFEPAGESFRVEEHVEFGVGTAFRLWKSEEIQYPANGAHVSPEEGCPLHPSSKQWG